MPVCKSCDSEVETLLSVKIEGRTKKVCEECADRAREEAELGEAGEAAMENMMGYKGRR